MSGDRVVVETESDPDHWTANRAWATSGNRISCDSHGQSWTSSKGIDNNNDDGSINDNGSVQQKVAATKNKQEQNNNGTTIYYPTTTEQIAEIVSSSTTIPIAIVGGGHEASNAPILAGRRNMIENDSDDNNNNNGNDDQEEKDNVIILDMQRMKRITTATTTTTTTATTTTSKTKTVTVEAGVVFRELAPVVRDCHGALPIGTGPDVGVIGYTINGGLSGYFSRRLGLLAQRVTQFTMVDADGHIHTLTKPAAIATATDDHHRHGHRKVQQKQHDYDDEDAARRRLFTAMLGAGSALGIITEMTFEMEQDGHDDDDENCHGSLSSIVRAADQYIYTAMSDNQACTNFSRWMIQYIRDTILPNPHISAELIVTADHTIIITMVSYHDDNSDDDNVVVVDDSNYGRTYWDPVRHKAQEAGLALVADQHWSDWYDISTSAWPVIDNMTGSPLAMIQHSCGTVGRPDDDAVDLIASSWIHDGLLQMGAEQSIVEVRTLGGHARRTGGRYNHPIPTGNCQHDFFADIIIMYDAGRKTLEERTAIRDAVSSIIVGRAKQLQHQQQQGRHDNDADRSLSRLVLDYSGTHSQVDDVQNPVDADTIFGGKDMADLVGTVKMTSDPHNRFRFHPFAKCLSSE